MLTNQPFVKGAVPRKAEDLYHSTSDGNVSPDSVVARRAALTPDPWSQGHTVTYTMFTEHGSYTHSDKISEKVRFTGNHYLCKCNHCNRTIRLVCPSVRLSVHQHFACNDNSTNINRIGPKLIPWMYLRSVLVKFEDGWPIFRGHGGRFQHENLQFSLVNTITQQILVTLGTNLYHGCISGVSW